MSSFPQMVSPGSELRRVRSLIADLDAIVWEADARTALFTFVSEGSEDILGYPPREWLAESNFWADHIVAEDRERVLGQFVHAITEGGKLDMEYRFVAKDRSIVWLRDLAHVVTDVDGEPALIRGLMVEITAQKSMEEERLNAEGRFRRVVERIPAIVYLETVNTKDDGIGETIYVSPQVETILGFAPQEWQQDPITWARQFHPDDRERVRAQYMGSQITDQPFICEYRMFAKDGRTLWFRDEAVLVRDETGAPEWWQGIMFDITGERESAARIRESEDRYRTLVETLPAIVYSEDVTGNGLQIMYINSRVEELLGISQDEWLRNPEVWLDAVHPDDRAEVDRVNRETEISGELFAIEYRMHARDGRVLWFHDEAVLVRDDDGNPRYWQGVMTDITARREAESQLAEAEARYRALVEQTPTITYIDALGGAVSTLYISPQTSGILGYSPQEWYEDPELWSKIVHPEDGTRDAYVSAEGSPHDSVYRLIAKDGRVVWVHDQARLISDEQGEPKYWQGVLVDITSQKRAESLERDLALERESADHLRTLDEMKNTFLQAVSHDLRTPLAAILGLAVTLEHGDDVGLDAETSRELAGRIAQNARKLERIVNDLLDLDRLSRGLVEPVLRPTDLGALVRGLIEDSDLLHGRTVYVDAPSVAVPIDGAKVERIVENLMGNTAKHTPPEASVWVRVEEVPDGVRIVFEDDGPGIPAELRDQVFDPFLQGASASSHSPGVGVGLTLVARFAEIHGGRAWVQEREGGGASFRVFLPSTAVVPVEAEEDEHQVIVKDEDS
ncbi:MAG: PAS domain-containing protein [Actinomycetota bacterium]